MNVYSFLEAEKEWENEDEQQLTLCDNDFMSLMRKCWSVYFGHEIFLVFVFILFVYRRRRISAAAVAVAAVAAAASVSLLSHFPCTHTHTLLVWFFSLSLSNKCVHSSKQNNNNNDRKQIYLAWPSPLPYQQNIVLGGSSSSSNQCKNLHEMQTKTRDQIISCWMHAQTGIRTRTSQAIHSITHNRSAGRRAWASRHGG